MDAKSDLPSNLTMIRRALDLLVAPGGVVETRALHVPGCRSGIVAGYFDAEHLDQAAEAAAILDRRQAAGVYFVLNELHPGLLARSPNRLTDNLKPLASDSDIIRRRWLPLDFDPVRPAGISSTEDEHRAALDTARACAAWLQSKGWPAPILADSGNGGHLLSRIDLAPGDAGLVKRCIEAIAECFDSDYVKVDRSVFNPARVWKVPYTTARKGHNLPDRPHRVARLIEEPEA